ncbi:MAG TPA: sigma-70 family RNA polymerase sigma factor [Candidatus Limnocylindria bacterium]|nr:sigma-70 family RNA polymerase sigma factor [Candidatus Limnocylindria bacterium]
MTSAPASSKAFAPTRWTLVLAARGETPAAKAALGELCEAYYQPVFRFFRREGHDEDAARELTQEFFARLLAGAGVANVAPERGRFRSFLLGAVKHFLGDHRNRERALKRGGGMIPEPLDPVGHGHGTAPGTAPGLQVADAAADRPDSFFDRQWAFALMDRALTGLAAELAAEGRATHFAALKPWLVGDTTALSQAEAARTLGLGEGAVKVAIHRLRKRFRELVRHEVAQTIPATEDVDTELRYLVEVLAAG